MSSALIENADDIFNIIGNYLKLTSIILIHVHNISMFINCNNSVITMNSKNWDTKHFLMLLIETMVGSVWCL